MAPLLVAPASLLVALALVGTFAACGGPRVASERVVLLTGFDPFGGRAVNESWEAVSRLEGETVRGRRVVVARLPVVYDEMAVPLAAALEAASPEVVISFGVGTDVVCVEREARNAYAASSPLDNAGKPPPRAAIVPGGAPTAATGLPVAAILARLGAEGVPARASDDAGGYLCNECFYRLMTTRGPGSDGVRARGFVHVPPQGAARPDGGAFDLATIERAVRAVVDEVLRDLDGRDAGAGR